ncbi:hypothetical protein GPOL_c40820 [Gordonia polyisoprenivorans VH2]|uniref:Uncharacterized protein n=1 Tax=Gordonia polyisoprenivorans (strain DSM 44266 / VH2) TaxID=1112204 RepID=H6MSW8_GORPV|nr:hypothetical protein [uncultured Gordonia sp.]AFA75089.1 hypothetical protein GPOL_c40820 [Gordonia polyisoprenivorans VH2]
MNPSVALLLCVACVGAALWSLLGLTSVPSPAWPTRVTVIVAVAVIAWTAGGLVAWMIGVDAPARPGVFLGYAASAVGLAAFGIPATTTLGRRGAAVARALVLALLAFVCWRAESVWLIGVPGMHG